MASTDKKLVVITGASSGIGEACAKLFSSFGHPLLLLARRVERMEALQLPKTLCHKCDVSDRAAVVTAIKLAEASFNCTVDLLINNAGVMHLTPCNVTQDPKEWETMLNVNVMGPLNCMHAVLPGMIERKTGTIINVSSIAGRMVFSPGAVYCGTKFCVHSMSEGIRAEVAGHGVRVSVVSPGAVATELLDHVTDDEFRASRKDWVDKDMGGGLPPSELADACAYIYRAPQNVCIRELCVAPTIQQL